MHGRVEEYTSKEGVQSAIFREIHQNWFFLAEEDSICQGALHKVFGYLAQSMMAEKILNGRYNYLPHFDDATWELCIECACITSIVPQSLVSQTISTRRTRLPQNRGYILAMTTRRGRNQLLSHNSMPSRQLY
jgi:hypothetical protein